MKSNREKVGGTLKAELFFRGTEHLYPILFLPLSSRRMHRLGIFGRR